MARIAYIRVSSEQQHLERQIENLKKYDIEKWFEEKVSGKNTDRPKLNEMLEYIRSGDTVYIHSFDRLARNTKDLLDIVELLEKKDVTLVSTKENIDTSTPTGKLMLTMIGAIATFERELIRERQAEGIKIAKEKGKFKGRQVKRIDDSLLLTEFEKYKKREISKKQLAENLNISRPTLDKLLKDKNLI